MLIVPMADAKNHGGFSFHAFSSRKPTSKCILFSGVKLSCGIHSCQSKCHQLNDHSKMLCKTVMTSNCANGHAQTWECHGKQPLTCRTCERDAKRAAEKQRKDFELQKKRDAEQQAHDEQMAKIGENLDAHVQAEKDLRLAKEREVALKQKEQDVRDVEERYRQKVVTEKKRKDEEAKGSIGQAASSSVASTVLGTVEAAVNDFPGTPAKKSTPEDAAVKKESEARSEWQRRKDIDGATNPHIDAVMEMIGLEAVKQQVLRIMDRVDVNVRQGTSLAEERFNVVLLGNPGTGLFAFSAYNVC